MDAAVDEHGEQGVAHEDMVDAAPASLVLVGAPCALVPFALGRDVGEAHFLAEIGQGAVGGVVVEVAGHDDVPRTGEADGVDGLADALRHTHTVGAGGPLAVDTTGGVYHEHVQGVGIAGDATGIEDVAGGMAPWRRFDAQRPVAEHSEGERRPHECHVDATLVVARCHDILIACVAKWRAVEQVVHHAVVFHLGEHDHVGQCPVAPFAAAGDEFLCDIVDFAPIALAVPFAHRGGQILMVVLSLGVTVVEEVLTVELH